MKPIPATVDQKLEKLQAKIPDHIELARLCIEANDGNVHSPDLWVNAAIRRSMQVLDGYVAMVRSRNLTCAGSLLRVQLDTAMRLFASTLVSDVDEFVGHLLKGGRLDKLKDRDGRRLTDGYLAKRLSEFSPGLDWVPRVYESTCDFIHMSGRHMLNMAEIKEELTLEISIALHDDRWPEKHMAEAVYAFDRASDVILGLVYKWWEQKSSYPAGMHSGGPS